MSYELAAILPEFLDKGGDRALPAPKMTRRLILSALFALLIAGTALLLLKQDRSPSKVLEQAIHGEPLPVITEGTSILTWNLQWFPGHKQSADPETERIQVEAVAGVLQEADADIVCLQEVKGEEAVNRLLALLPDYRMQVISDFWGVQEIVILSKVDAVTAYAEKFVARGEEDPPRGFGHATFDFDGHRLLVYSVHFKSNYGGIEANIPVREESARQLLDHVEETKALHLGDGAKSVSVVLGGDFNTSLLSESFAAEQTGRLILEGGFEWGFRGLPEEETITWLSDGRYPDVTFDHFFAQAGNGAEVGRSVVLPTERDVSDHRPVIMTAAIHR